jgi:uncharacterized phage protein gp47/JayE
VVDLTGELQIANETPDTIRARLIADTNAGIDPSDPAYADTILGSLWDDLSGADALEFDRLYDRLNEVAAAAIPALSFGTFLDAWAESLGRTRNDAALAGGSLRFSGTNGTVIPAGTRASTPQTSADEDEVEFVTTEGGTIASGIVDLEAVAIVAGSAGNVPASTVTLLDTAIAGVSVTNPAAMTGGADVETDEALQKRLLRQLSNPSGPGNADYYVNLALDTPGVGFVTVQPNTPSVGFVKVVITDVNNDPAPTPLVDALQERLDPSSSAAQGAGQSTIGATVDVDTPTSLAVTVEADVTLATGYSLDGDAGTHAVRGPIEASLGRYVNGLPVSGDVLHNFVIAAIVAVPGVINVNRTTLELNNVVGDVSVSSTQVASLSTVTLT